ncbi:MAG: 50S ribosomal protein L29 [Patescibacteria group bacterium]
MKKSFKELKNKSVADLNKDIATTRDELMKGSMESRSNPQKDTNMISKKKQRLAVLLTALTQQKEAAKFINKEKTK